MGGPGVDFKTGKSSGKPLLLPVLKQVRIGPLVLSLLLPPPEQSEMGRGKQK